MQKFLVVYMAPIAGMEEWMKTDPLIRKAEEEKMMAEWDAWMEEHKSIFAEETAAIGKTKRVTAGGIEDTKNDMMMYSIVNASSHEEAAEIFKNHPHFGIPNGSIEIMPISYLSQMEG